ncbi:MAG: hypothetical protein AAGB31_11640, partial [Bdellovibrio sp.]
QDSFNYNLSPSPSLSHLSDKTVIFGEDDPYIANVQNEVDYWRSAGFLVRTCHGAGHHPHLESNLQILD